MAPGQKKYARIPFLFPGDAEDRTCPACDREFKTPGGLSSHLSTAKSCLWYRKGKNRDLWASVPDVVEDIARENAVPSGARAMDVEDRDSDSEDLLNDFQDVLENRDLFSFVLTGPPTASCSSGEPQASSSTGRIFQPPTAPPQMLSLDDDEDTRIEEEDLLAGKVIRMDARVVETWKVFFSGDSDGEDRMEVDGEDEAEGRGEDIWRPFASELDWRVAMWIVREDVGQNSMNRFLSIPGVRICLILLFKPA
ncbi:uncharacterized protein C8Q71DRAFT_700197 [Rhodofomes roseus]|uniref:C2H2-type domain-containing protein n=1 Tax=Rhodofomes roseus TaxID=34475 RepID=A0ABQ8KT69_9APHY|nr:uncharacterized protein C8Q71DRAFT_700197 [Rhodofomes roseus]KAH9841974.1 hypothetical protein C8Q71DRAFT_700197 [Rhodofomes roseus]